MTEIPEDVMKAAREAMGRIHGAPEFVLYERCARAILAERERCANVAYEQGRHMGGAAVAFHIAAAIRNP